MKNITGSEATLAELERIRQKIEKTALPPDLKEKALLMLERAEITFRYGGNFYNIEQVSGYVDWITALPWHNRSEDNLDLRQAAQVLEKNHYGLKEIKDRILEYLSVLQLNAKTDYSRLRAPILFFVGLVGTGKTTIAVSIAEAMGRRFVRIPFGGMGSALDLRGLSRVHPEAEPGLVIKALRRAGTRNPVILLDELDRVSEQARSDIMGVLVELLDPEQNSAFLDHYLDYSFDLSQVLFVATANNTGNISTAVLDRLEAIQMPSYSDEEKIKIGRDYIFPKTLSVCGLNPNQLKIDEGTWPLIVRPLGFDAGMRTLERTIGGICRKIARLLVEGKGSQFYLTPQNIKEYLPSW